MEFQRERVYTALNADELKQGDKVIVADCMALLREFVRSGDDIVVIREICSEENEERFFIENDTMYALAYLVERKENCANCENYLKDECGIKEGDNPIRCWNYKPKIEGCGEVCSDDRFEIIASAKEHIIEATNIKTSADEMKVLDNILFRCWQMGWLRQYEKTEQIEPAAKCINCKYYAFGCCKKHDEPTSHEASCEDYSSRNKPKAEKHYRPFKDTDELIKVWGERAGAVARITRLDMPHIWVRKKNNFCGLKGELITRFEDSFVDVNGATVAVSRLYTDYEFLDSSPCGVEE